MKALLISLTALLASGCTTVNLFDRDSYCMTQAGDSIMRGTNVIMVTKEQGIWYSKTGVEKLQKAKVLK